MSIQTNEDALNESVQTENPTMLTKWTQNPSVSGQSVGGEQAVADKKDPYETYFAVSSDSKRLTKFLSSASQVRIDKIFTIASLHYLSFRLCCNYWKKNLPIAKMSL